MGKHIIWASAADEKNVLAPSADKQAKGWVEEVPPHEWFNWYMRRNDTRLNTLEEPLAHVVLDMPAITRNKAIKKGERFNLPANYVVGSGQLHVYMDGLLCHEGSEQQYVECGQLFSESNYIRWNDDIPEEFDIRVEIPLRSLEPSIYADEKLVGDVTSLLERVGRLEEPKYGAVLDSPANTRTEIIRAGELFTLSTDYIVGANCLAVFRNGILLYPCVDYNEVGNTGEKACDIVFLKNIPVDDNIRVHILLRNDEENILLGAATSLKTLAQKVEELTREVRIDELIKRRIEALSDYRVPPYKVGTNSLRIFKNGVLLVPNRDYSENADEGPISTRIIWNASVEKNTLITVVVPANLATESN